MSPEILAALIGLAVGAVAGVIGGYVVRGVKVGFARRKTENIPALRNHLFCLTGNRKRKRGAYAGYSFVEHTIAFHLLLTFFSQFDPARGREEVRDLHDMPHTPQ